MLSTLITRLFTLICLMVGILAFGLIGVLQDTDSPTFSSRVERSTPCVFDSGGSCVPGDMGSKIDDT
ncbi:MAG: hypothetical protein AAFY99_15145 [Pseudomonadota bacterium]